MMAFFSRPKWDSAFGGMKAFESFTARLKGRSMKLMKSRAIFAALIAMIAGLGAGPAQAVLPNPILYMTTTEFYTVNGQNFVRYRYDVLNRAAYVADMFAAAPALPPCGNNHNSSRSW